MSHAGAAMMSPKAGLKGDAMRQRSNSRARFGAALVLAALVTAGGLFAHLFASSGFQDDSERLLTIDHYVRVRSSVPAIAGQPAQIYVRERARAGTMLRASTLAGRVVLFVHGAGTPGEVAFDVPYQDYSWMAYLANAGFDVFSMDFTGYGRSTRPPAMNDPCNLSAEQQQAFIPGLLAAPCAASYPNQLTTIASDWDDLSAVVDYIRSLRRVDRVSLVAWSLGGPRSGGFAARHPDKVDKLVLLAPAFNRTSSSNPPAKLPADGVAMNKQSREDFRANWDRQVGCADQYDPAVSDVVWSASLEADPVGATWGAGVRRAPSTTVWGWNGDVVAKLQAPTLMVAGAHDKQVLPDRVRELYSAIGSPQKMLVDLACSSHNAMWERNHLVLFRASLDWLTQGAVNGTKEGTVRLGYGVP
jgi:pimeloyl-ACP methyl ester carboxylesterase